PGERLCICRTVLQAGHSLQVHGWRITEELRGNRKERYCVANEHSYVDRPTNIQTKRPICCAEADRLARELARVARLPLLDRRSDEDILGYDDDWLPS